MTIRSFDVNATSHDIPLPEIVANHACYHPDPETPNCGVTPIMAAMAGARNAPRPRFRFGFGGIAGDRSPPRRPGQLPALPATVKCTGPRKRTVSRTRRRPPRMYIVALRNERERTGVIEQGSFEFAVPARLKGGVSAPWDASALPGRREAVLVGVRVFQAFPLIGARAIFEMRQDTLERAAKAGPES